MGNRKCPQADTALLPLVKPADFVVPGTQKRQAARAAKRVDEDAEEMLEGKDAVAAVPEGNAANFPALECLALSWSHRNNRYSVDVSMWMLAQLRLSYEYEVVEEWKAEQVTLGEAELLKTMA